MGDIYKAVQEPFNRTVALKVLPPSLSRAEEFSKRFEIEAKAISLLQHQNIVSLYEYGEDDGLRYFAMQFIDGENLWQICNKKKMLPITEVINYAKQICRGLRYAHAKEIIHRDIKSQNILIDKNNIVRITDFGIAKIVSSVDITMTGVTVGTPEYMSPEQAEGLTLDAQTDIYSLGIVMYEMATRSVPFTAESAMAVAYKQVNELPPPPSLRRKDIPKRLELIILKALKKNKKDRYVSVEEMLQHLDSVDLNEHVESPTVSVAVHGRDKDNATSDTKDKRITDRRSGDRRRGRFGLSASEEGYGYWLDVVRMNWLTWLLLSFVAVLLIAHLKKII